jgi:UTP:GlnB (protein PII) uridylyltransferase
MSPAARREPVFYETMPRRYQQLFRGPSVHEHAAIVGRRGDAPAYAEIWRRLPQGGAIVCLVAENRPGVLAYVGMAFAAQSIDILAAHAYGRWDPKGAEVVDLFWLRRDEDVAPSLVEDDLIRVADLVGGLITGDLRIDGRPPGPRLAPTADSATLVRFDEGNRTNVAVLTLDTIERPGLFRAATEALQRSNVRIHGSRRVPGPGGRVVLRFDISDQDGRWPDQYRRGVLQAEVLRVAEAAAHGVPSQPPLPDFREDPLDQASPV